MKTQNKKIKHTKTQPLTKKEQVEKSNDKHIDEDFEGFPHSPAKENIINPKTSAEKKVAGTENANNKKQQHSKKHHTESLGSGSAFEKTERSIEETKEDDSAGEENY
jgi:hypothetical protein